jgi:hypothetical protein
MRLSTLFHSAGTARHRTIHERLRHYDEELAQLRAENEQLRRSAQAFGELAERLSEALRERPANGTQSP